MLLYEQCSENRAEQIPSSTILSGRPRAVWMFANSCFLRPCSRASDSVASLNQGKPTRLSWGILVETEVVDMVYRTLCY